MKFKNVSQSVIIGISLLVTILSNLVRILRINSSSNDIGNITQTSVSDVLVRFLFLFSFSWIALQFNSNWKYNYIKTNGNLRFFISVLLNVIFGIAACQLFFVIYESTTDIELVTSNKNILYFSYGIILLILAFVARILRYQILVQQEMVENEKLKQENLKNELAALKNQVNPHFLFNSLNSLSSLVKENKEATTFIGKLSFLYRYILQSSERDLITLEEELKFLESYVYLIQIRYREKFDISIDINPKFLQNEVPVLALQLLVENAVKHNEISNTNPLKVTISCKDNAIIVENPIKPRTTFVDSTGNGLVNLNKRYAALKKGTITINNSNNIFKVTLPI